MFCCLYMLGLDSKSQKGLFLWAKILLGISEEEAADEKEEWAIKFGPTLLSY